MRACSELHIVVPGLCGPLAELQTLENNSTVNRWIKCLSRSVITPSSTSAQGVLSSLLNLPACNNFPAATFAMLTQESYDDSKYYMFADPVHLQADIDHAILTSSDDLDLQANDSDSFCMLLNEHFYQDDLFFQCINKDQWVVVSKKKIQLDTAPLTETIGRNINFLLPKGKGSSVWNRVLTEVQMLMHSHDINAVREASGQQSINSVWFHGSGDLPDLSDPPSLCICSNDIVFEGLASHAGCDYLPVPLLFETYKDTLLSQVSDIHVLHLSDLEHLVNYSDVNVWLDKLTDVLNAWIYPLIHYANKNNVRVTLYPCNKKQYRFSRYDSYKFWRQGNLEQHVSKY